MKTNIKLIFNRYNRLKEGAAPIYIEVAFNRTQRKFINTKILIAPNQWNDKKKEINNKYPAYIETNLYLRKMVDEILQYEASLLNSGKVLTSNLLDELLNGKKDNTKLFYKFVQDEFNKENLAIGTYKKNRAIDSSKNWLQITAEALEVKIVQRMCFGTKNVPFYPRIKYKYFIDNKKYISDNMFLQKCNQYYFEDDAKSLVKTLVKDSKIKCFVNPKNFEQSIVITDVRKDSYLVWFLMTYFMSFVMIYGLFY